MQLTLKVRVLSKKNTLNLESIVCIISCSFIRKCSMKRPLENSAVNKYSFMPPFTLGLSEGIVLKSMTTHANELANCADGTQQSKTKFKLC